MPDRHLNLEQLIDRIIDITRSSEIISFGTILEAVGKRSTGPLLITAGLVLTSPLSGIPGIPTTMGFFILTISVQHLFRKNGFWFPEWILKRKLKKKNLDRGLNKIRPAAKFTDRFTRPRLTILVRSTGSYVIAVICSAIALCMPLMEVVPFSASIAGLIITIYGLTLMSYDGLLASAAFILTGFSAVFALYNIIFL